MGGGRSKADDDVVIVGGDDDDDDRDLDEPNRSSGGGGALIGEDSDGDHISSPSVCLDMAGSDRGEAFSRSAKRHACEQYAPPVVCRSHVRQKSNDQTMLTMITMKILSSSSSSSAYSSAGRD